MVGTIECVRSPVGRLVSNVVKNDRRHKSSKTPFCENTWKKHVQECFITDPKYFWVERTPCSRTDTKTWHDVEEQYCCSLLSRCSKKSAPSRIKFQAEELYHAVGTRIKVCKLGCLETCELPPCDIPEYSTCWQSVLDSVKRLLAFTLFLGLIYVTHKWHVWDSSSDTLAAFLGDPDAKIDRIVHSVVTTAADKWNRTVAVLFGVVKQIVCVKEKTEEFNKCDFILKIQDGVRAEKEMLKQKHQEVKCGVPIEEGHVFQRWELIYNYHLMKPGITEEECEFSWKWTDHSEEGYVETSSVVIPYESNAKALTKSKKSKKPTLASIYTDLSSKWSVNTCATNEATKECTDPKSRIVRCKRRYERKYKSKVDPSRCTCPVSTQECQCYAEEDDEDA